MRKSETSILPVFVTGYSSVIIQCVFLREILAVFSGNEIVLGILFSLWLLFCGMGSFLGNKFGVWKTLPYVLLFILSSILGIFLIRYFPKLFDPGSVIPAFAIALLFILAEAPVSFLSGYAFGTISKISEAKSKLYSLENTGALIGAIIVFFLTLIDASNVIIYTFAIVPLPASLFFYRKKIFATSVAFVSILLLSIILMKVDRKAASWKYAGNVCNIQYTKEGEVANMLFEKDTTIMLNNTVYKTTLNKSAIEQAVHIPVAQRKSKSNTLIIFDRGHYSELIKYPKLKIDIIETLPVVARKQSVITTPEQYNPDKKYDLIFLGAAIPVNTATSRFYTVSFMERLHSFMSDSAVLSYTLPFTESYMSKNERMLFNSLGNALRSVFQHVLIFPGNGYMTFMASDVVLHIPESVSVKTDYLSAYTIPSLFEEKINEANTVSKDVSANKNTRPIALYYSLKNWMNTFGFSAVYLFSILLIVLVIMIVILPKSLSVLSVSTNGFTTGIYSIGILLFYQATYGSLYSEISLLLIALNIGFVIGARIKNIPLSDLMTGVYCIVSIFLLGIMQQPPKILFILCHAGIGILSAGQFVTRKNTSPGILNTADLSGGVFGMALGATLLIPLFGVMTVAIGVFVLKVVVEVVILIKSKKTNLLKPLV